MKNELLIALPLIAGALLWLIGGNFVLQRARRLEGLRWPTFPSPGSFTLGEVLAMTAFFLSMMAGFWFTVSR